MVYIISWKVNNMKNTGNSDSRHEIVERYCPKCNENVILKRISGLNTTYKCMNFEKCKELKDEFCTYGSKR